MVKKIISFILIFIIYYFVFANETKERKLKTDMAFFSLAYFHVYEQNIPNNLLQKYLLAIESFGDKKFIKEQFIKEILFSKEKKDLDAIYIPLIDEKAIFPKITVNKLQEIIYLINFFVCNEIYLFNKGVMLDFNIANIMIEKIRKKSPIIFQILDSDKDYSCEEFSTEIMNTYKNHPLEINFFIEYFLHEFQLSGYSDKELFLLNRINSIKNKYSILNYTIICNDNSDVLIGSNENNIMRLKTFKEIFPLLLNRQQKIEEIEIFNDISNNLNNENIKILYYLIMTSEEYQYY